MARPTPLSKACERWATTAQAAGCRIVVPEIADYEVRRELIRAGKRKSIALLNLAAHQFDYLPITTPSMHFAAELWAQARGAGQPTAPATIHSTPTLSWLPKR